MTPLFHVKLSQRDHGCGAAAGSASPQQTDNYQHPSVAAESPQNVPTPPFLGEETGREKENGNEETVKMGSEGRRGRT